MNGERGVTTIVVGPVHAGIIEPGRFTFHSGGENVLRLEARLGFSSRGVERALHGRDAVAAAPRVARICGACSAARSWAYAQALEAIAATRCDERVELARLLVAELERAYNHTFDLASACSAAGYARGQMTGLRIKESLHRLNTAGFGHRLLFDAIRPGGVRAASFDGPDLRLRLRAVRGEVAGFIDDIFANESVQRRFERTGEVSAETAARLGATGPALRASGGTHDERIARPYGAYAGFASPAVRLHRGDVEARCRVKAGELVHALELCDAALAQLGSCAFPALQNLDLQRGTAEGIVEGPRGTESVRVAVGDGGKIDAIEVRSASARNWPVAVEAMTGNIVPDFPLVNKSFNLCYACADL